MLPFLKKKSNAATAPVVPAWHPNFRNYEKLPDIKVVRTAFFVNGAAITIALVLAIYFGRNEWQIRTLHGQIDDAKRQIEKNKKPSDAEVALFKKFQAEEAKIAEVDAFVKARPAFSEIMIRLAETRPDNIAFDTIDLRENGLFLRFSVKGAQDAAGGYATAYQKKLEADKKLQELFEEVGFSGSPTRNVSTGRLNVEFFLRLKGAKKP